MLRNTFFGLEYFYKCLW